MGYSIFKNTMVDLTYPQIEEAIQNGACVLVPISVVEEHGPHLCTGTDIYLTENICEKIKSSLDKKGKPALIAPPFFWGINSITNGFVGSFSISPGLMENLLLEILENLQKWGVEKIFLFNFHGDYVHIRKIAEIAKKAYEDKQMGVYFVNTHNVFANFGLDQNAPYLVNANLEPAASSFMDTNDMDIHAGASETSWMLLNYADLADASIARQMEPAKLSIPELKIWLHGGEKAKEITPLGYLGNPADINLEKIQAFELETIEAFTNTICKILE